MKDPRNIIWNTMPPGIDVRSCPLAMTVVCGVLSPDPGYGLFTRQSIDRPDALHGRACPGLRRVVERLAQRTSTISIGSARTAPSRGRFTPLSESMLATQRSFMASLVEIARDVDRDWKEGRLSNDSLKKLAAERGVWLIAALNREGVSVYSSRLLPADGERNDTAGSRPVTLSGLNRLSEKKRISFIALRRPDGSGRPSLPWMPRPTVPSESGSP